MSPRVKVGYTRTGKLLHAVQSGRTLCGRPGWVHPDHDREDSGPVELVLNLNAGCMRCQRGL